MNAPVPPDVLTMWIELLRSSSPTHRRVALRVLSRVGALPTGVIQELLHLLTDNDLETQRSALNVLAGVARLPESAVTAICRAAVDPNATTDTRIAAIQALTRPVELPSDVIDLLIDWTYDPEVAIRTAAVEALGTCKNTNRELIDALIERLRDPVDSVRIATAEPLAAKGLNDPRVPHIFVHAVRDTVFSVRCAIARAMSQFRTPSEELQSAWLPLLNDHEMIVRQETLDAIAKLDAPGHEIIDYLVTLVDVPDVDLGARATRTLCSFRGLSENTLAVLIRVLTTHWESSGQEIRDCLRAHSPLSEDLLQEVMDLAMISPVGGSQIKRTLSGLRVLALEILSYSSEATAAVRIMMDAASQAENPDVQCAALRGLGRLRRMRSGVKETLLQMLSATDVNVRAAACVALATLIRTMADPPFQPSEFSQIASTIAGLLNQITPRASWESGTDLQNDLLMALRWVVARSRPTHPKLPAESEQLAGYPD